MNSTFTNLINLIVFRSPGFAACSLPQPFSQNPSLPWAHPLPGSFGLLRGAVSPSSLYGGLSAHGLGWRRLLGSFGFLTFTEYPTLLGVPYWMLILWLNFGLMLRPLFTWFLNQRWRCLIGFSIGGALAYFSRTKAWRTDLSPGLVFRICGRL